MGSCFSTPGKGIGAAADGNREVAAGRQTEHMQKPGEWVGDKQQQQQHPGIEREKEKVKEKEKGAVAEVGRKRRSSGVVPCGKVTDFGFAKDFDSQYVIGKLLGHGQFGYTFAAVDRVNGDKVAVKRIEKTKMVLPIAVDDVKREVKIFRALKGHENVVHFYNAFEDANYVYIVMDYLGDLKRKK